MSKNVNWAPTRVGLSLKQVNRNYHYSKIVCRTSPPKINIEQSQCIRQGGRVGHFCNKKTTDSSSPWIFSKRLKSGVRHLLMHLLCFHLVPQCNYVLYLTSVKIQINDKSKYKSHSYQLGLLLLLLLLFFVLFTPMGLLVYCQKLYG